MLTDTSSVHHSVIVCLGLLSTAVIRTMTKKQHGEGKVNLTYTSQSQSIIEGSQVSNSCRTRGRSHGGTVLAACSPRFIQLAFYATQDYLPRGGTTHSSPDLPYQHY